MDKLTKERSSAIRRKTPDCLEGLYEMQNRICDLCDKPIQDIVLAVIEHSVPIIKYSKSDMPVEEASVIANDMKNLRAAHSVCNASKGAMTRDEWFAAGRDKLVGEFREYSEGELENLRWRARVGGLAAGKKNKESGHMARLGRTGMGGRIGGPKVGRIAVETGQIYTIQSFESCSKGGKIGGRVTASIPGHMSKAGRLGGQAAVKSGQLRSICAVGGRAAAANPINIERAKKWGSELGRRNAESGHLKYILHDRWHTKRNLLKGGCLFCDELKEAV